jgi:hypothetical protein
MKKMFIQILSINLIFTTFSWSGTGTSGAQFLQLAGGGRASALGGAYTAFAQGLESVYYNPAGITTLRQKSAGFTHSELYADMSYENVALGIPLSFGAITFSANALLSGDIGITTLEDPQGTGETYSANDFSFNISYARILTDKFSAGITFKYLIMNLAEVQALGVAFDAGATYNTGVKNIRIGFAINNFGPDMSYKGQALEFQTRIAENENQASDVNANYVAELFQLPLTFRVGVAYDPINNENHRVTLMADGLNPNDQAENLAVGLEYCYKDKYYIRGGHAGLLNDGIQNGGINQITYSFGAGALVEMNNMGIVFDYAFEDHKYLSNISKFTIGLIF